MSKFDLFIINSQSGPYKTPEGFNQLGNTPINYSGLPYAVSGIVGLSSATSTTIYSPNIIKQLKADNAITNAVFAFYLTTSDQTSYFDIGRVDQTAMYDASNLKMMPVVT